MKKVPQEQIDRFKQAARELGCDKDEAAFDEKIKAIIAPTKQPVSSEKPPHSLKR